MTKQSAMVTVYPDERAWLDGVPAVPTTLPAHEAERLVASGAFHYEALEAPASPAGEPAPENEEDIA